MALHTLSKRVAAALAAAGLAACAHAPQPPPFPPAAPTVAPHVATGTYDLTTTLKRTPPPPPRTTRGRRPTRPAPEPTPSLELVYRPVAALDATAQSRTQLAATITIPGYTRAPRGRTGQSATWWPLPGDSVIVHFQSQQPGGAIDLRGVLKGDTLAGEIWYTSLQSGAVFQMGNFTAAKRK